MSCSINLIEAWGIAWPSTLTGLTQIASTCFRARIRRLSDITTALDQQLGSSVLSLGACSGMSNYHFRPPAVSVGRGEKAFWRLDWALGQSLSKA